MTKIEKSLAALILCIALVPNVPAQSETERPVSWEKFLRDSAVSREMLDIFADPDIPSWARFDPELGYTLGKYLPRDGIDGSLTISTSQADGTRTSRLYTDKPRRINAYGNSFTQCHQVSDGETWEEYLAAHLGEPIRNFGMGGYGVYQSYRRMIREESRLSSAQKGTEDEKDRRVTCY